MQNKCCWIALGVNCMHLRQSEGYWFNMAPTPAIFYSPQAHSARFSSTYFIPQAHLAGYTWQQWPSLFSTSHGAGPTYWQQQFPSTWHEEVVVSFCLLILCKTRSTGFQWFSPVLHWVKVGKYLLLLRIYESIQVLWLKEYKRKGSFLNIYARILIVRGVWIF